MAWNKTNKPNEPTWGSDTKPMLHVPRGRILTPDGNQILLGSSSSEILIYQAFSSLYGSVVKTISSWTKQVKQSA